MTKTMEYKLVWFSYLLAARLSGVNSTEALTAATRVLDAYKKTFP